MWWFLWVVWTNIVHGGNTTESVQELRSSTPSLISCFWDRVPAVRRRHAQIHTPLPPQPQLSVKMETEKCSGFQAPSSPGEMRPSTNNCSPLSVQGSRHTLLIYCILTTCSSSMAIWMKMDPIGSDIWNLVTRDWYYLKWLRGMAFFFGESVSLWMDFEDSKAYAKPSVSLSSSCPKIWM